MSTWSPHRYTSAAHNGRCDNCGHGPRDYAHLAAYFTPREEPSREPAHEPPATREAASTLPRVKAFSVVSEVTGRTLLTAPVIERTVAASDGNDNFMYLEGAYVGADVPNRNRALWTIGDLQFGQPSVVDGPLNWLHREREIVGSLTGSTLHERATADEADFQPHIRTTSVMWRYLFPGRAAFMAECAAAGALAQSMECIAEKVRFLDPDGNEAYAAPYAEMFQAGSRAAMHRRDTAMTVHYVNPTFLGAGVIVPPVMPGWEKANVDIVERAMAWAADALEASGFVGDEATWFGMVASVQALADGTRLSLNDE